MVAARRLDDGGLEDGLCRLSDPLGSLPPMPNRDYHQRRKEGSHGATLVISLCAVFVTATTSVVGVASDELPAAFVWTAIAAIWTEAIVALVCLAGLMFGDPGEVKRSREACFPLPPVVEEKLAAGDTSYLDLPNIVDGDRSFCTRCNIWRPQGVGRVHHCRICQRCVVHFDHHCGVFGRCMYPRWDSNPHPAVHVFLDPSSLTASGPLPVPGPLVRPARALVTFFLPFLLSLLRDFVTS